MKDFRGLGAVWEALQNKKPSWTPEKVKKHPESQLKDKTMFQSLRWLMPSMNLLTYPAYMIFTLNESDDEICVVKIKFSHKDIYVTFPWNSDSLTR